MQLLQLLANKLEQFDRAVQRRSLLPMGLVQVVEIAALVADEVAAHVLGVEVASLVKSVPFALASPAATAFVV